MDDPHRRLAIGAGDLLAPVEIAEVRDDDVSALTPRVQDVGVAVDPDAVEGVRLDSGSDEDPDVVSCCGESGEEFVGGEEGSDSGAFGVVREGGDDEDASDGTSELSAVAETRASLVSCVKWPVIFKPWARWKFATALRRSFP